MFRLNNLETGLFGLYNLETGMFGLNNQKRECLDYKI